jgi:Putative zinc-finger
MTICLNEETIQAYFDGELPADAAAAVLTHLNGCTTCAAFAREVERAVILIKSAFDDELPENVPSVSLRARLESALAQTKTPTAVDHSFGRHLYDLVSARLHAGELSSLRLGFAVAVVVAVVILAGGLARNLWRSTTPEQKKEMVGPAPVPARTPTLQHQVKTQSPETVAGSKGHQAMRILRIDRIARRVKPEPARPEIGKQIVQATSIPTVRHIRHIWDTTLRNPETSEHLRQTQLLLRSFRNTSIDEEKAIFDLAYEKRLSRELLSKNRLFRRSAEKKEDSQAKELLNQIEPLLLDIANLPDTPSQDDVLLIKELMREQKIIATLQIYTARAGF